MHACMNSIYVCIYSVTKHRHALDAETQIFGLNTRVNHDICVRTREDSHATEVPSPPHPEVQGRFERKNKEGFQGWFARKKICVRTCKDSHATEVQVRLIQRCKEGPLHKVWPPHRHGPHGKAERRVALQLQRDQFIPAWLVSRQICLEKGLPHKSCMHQTSERFLRCIPNAIHTTHGVLYIPALATMLYMYIYIHTHTHIHTSTEQSQIEFEHVSFTSDHAFLSPVSPPASCLIAPSDPGLPWNLCVCVSSSVCKTCNNRLVITYALYVSV